MTFHGSLPPSEVLIGVDIGTSRTKCVVLDTDGQERRVEVRATPWRTVPSGAEINPQTLLNTCVELLRSAVDALPGSQVLGVGVTSIAETGFVCDAAGSPLGPGIRWNDSRGTEQAHRFQSELSAEEFTRTTGLTVTAVPSLFKLKLLAEASPPTSDASWLNVAEWIVVAMGGRPAAELSLASRTGLLDVTSGAAAEELLDWLGVPVSFLPPPVQAGTVLGRASDLVPSLENAVLVVGGHDHVCAAVGAGATQDGDVLNSVGTAEAFIGSRRKVRPGQIDAAAADGVDIGRHVLPERFSVISGLRTGISLRRLLSLLNAADLTPLENRASRERPVGLRLAGLLGDTLEIVVSGDHVTAADLWNAALVEVDAAAAEAFAAVRAHTDTVSRVVAVGGWLASRRLVALKRARLPGFHVAPVDEAAARGAALLAGVGAGVWTDAFDVPRPAGSSPALS